MAFNSRRFRNFFPPLFDELFELVIEDGVVVQSDTWSDLFMSLTNWLTTDTENWRRLSSWTYRLSRYKTSKRLHYCQFFRNTIQKNINNLKNGFQNLGSDTTVRRLARHRFSKKKRMNEKTIFFYAFLFFTAEKPTNLLLRFLGESMARQSAFGFIWPLAKKTLQSLKPRGRENRLKSMVLKKRLYLWKRLPRLIYCTKLTYRTK